MVNTRQLEKQWYKYKAKKLMSVGSIVVGTLLILTASYFAFKMYQAQSTNTLRETKVMAVTKDYDKPMVDSSQISTGVKEVEKEDKKIKENQNNNLSLEPVIPVIDMDKEEKIKAHITKKHHKKTYKKPKKSVKTVRAKKSTYLTADELATLNGTHLDSTKRKKIDLSGSSDNYMETMKKKFSKSKQPREALLLAKAYYASGTYDKSEKWALTANKLNSALAESWYLFAKSKAKLGKQDEAIKILVTYYKKSHAPKAKIIIEKIKSGKL